MEVGSHVLNDTQWAAYHEAGHVTVPNVFSADEIDAAIADVAAWSAEFLESLSPEKRQWFLEQGSEQPLLRKLDNPVYHRDAFRSLASSPKLLSIVRQVLGGSGCVFFSQIFLEPPEHGGPKPIHQDNFYFGPDSLDATLTVWVALDEATIENGCLYYGDGSHQHDVIPHWAPDDEPFNLQASSEITELFPMTPAPVPRGGVSFHHGNTLHQSSANRSQHPRRALAMHFLRDGAELIQPALPYDDSVRVELS